MIAAIATNGWAEFFRFLAKTIPASEFGKGVVFGLVAGVFCAGFCLLLIGRGGYQASIRELRLIVSSKEKEISELKTEMADKDLRIKELHKTIEKRRGRR